MTVADAFNNFIKEKRLAGLTDGSIRSYEEHVGIFIKFVGAATKMHLLNRELIDEYRADLFNRNIAKATIHSYVRDVKAFLVWVEEEYHFNYNAKTIKVPKTTKTSPRIYSDEDMALIFKNIIAESKWLEIRNKCMIALMYDSGLRQSEICKLRKVDVDYNTNTMLIHGKGDKLRTVPLGSFSKELMQQYLEICPHESKYIFVDRHGGNITTNALKQLCTKIARRLPFEFSCHKLRHNYATNYCLDLLEREQSVDIYTLKELMGHEDISTTERYLHIAQQLFASKHHFSHLDKIRSKLA